MKTTETTPAVQTQNNEVALNNQGFAITPINIQSGNLPVLEDAQEVNIDLMSDYWSPENVNEFKRVFYVKTETCPVVDQQTGELIDLECSFFLERSKTGTKMLRNGSKRLVAVLNTLQQGMPIQITYLGKKKNRTNGFQSDNWSVKPLMIQG